jgi:hypothetical protein
MKKVDVYRQFLRSHEEWDAYLLQNSGLPGPRGNIELARAVALEGDVALFEQYLSFDPSVAPTNSPEEFLAFCGILGLGRLLSEGQTDWLAVLLDFASDPRWRAREAVAMALQALGKVDMLTLIREMKIWAQGSPLEQRAAAAALCEPGLLSDPGEAKAVLQILDDITASIPLVEDRRSYDFKVLRKAMGYCWSVATVACPEVGQGMMERWMSHAGKDVRWIMKENLRKKRLSRLDSGWVEHWRGILESSSR